VHEVNHSKEERNLEQSSKIKRDQETRRKILKINKNISYTYFLEVIYHSIRYTLNLIKTVKRGKKKFSKHAFENTVPSGAHLRTRHCPFEHV